MNKQSLVFGAAVAMLFAFLVAASMFRGDRAEEIGFLAQENASVLAPVHAQTKGPADAKVYLIEFFDPACETCAKFHPAVEALLATYPGKLRLVLRYAPFHPGSEDMVKILEAARKQDKYWEVLEMMFATQPAWASHGHPQPERIWEFLPKTGVDVERLKADLNDTSVDALIEQDLADAATLGIRKTPGFLVNGKPLTSFGYAQLKALVDSEIAANYP